MNENSQNSPNEAAAPKNEKRRFETMADALRAGKDEGSAKAREKCPELKSGISDVAHDLAYGLAFGSVFAGAFLNELIPRAIREGLSKGASAGRTAGQKASQEVEEGLSADFEGVGQGNPPNPSFS